MASSTTIARPNDPRLVTINVMTHDKRVWIEARIDGNEVTLHLPQDTSFATAAKAAKALRECYAPVAAVKAPRMAEVA